MEKCLHMTRIHVGTTGHKSFRGASKTMSPGSMATDAEAYGVRARVLRTRPDDTMKNLRRSRASGAPRTSTELSLRMNANLAGR